MGAMNIDCELLEMAAKANGVAVELRDKAGFEGRKNAPKAFYPKVGVREWNPRVYDGDALRLLCVVKKWASDNGGGAHVPWSNELYRALGSIELALRCGDIEQLKEETVRAAAEIGRSMP